VTDNLENTLHHVEPAEEHVPRGFGQVLAGGDKLFQDRPAVTEPVLQDEAVEGAYQLVLVGNNYVVHAVRSKRGAESLAVTGTEGELDQLPLQGPALLHEVVHQLSCQHSAPPGLSFQRHW
jgi:hypothetical protein